MCGCKESFRLSHFDTLNEIVIYFGRVWRNAANTGNITPPRLKMLKARPKYIYIHLETFSDLTNRYFSGKCLHNYCQNTRWLHVAVFQVIQDSSVALCRQLALPCQLSFFFVNHLALFEVGLDVWTRFALHAQLCVTD